MEELYHQYDTDWGFYKPIHQRDVLPTGKTQTKLLYINPNSTMAAQTHAQRMEHWIIVQGTPYITIGAIRRKYGATSHLYIPKGSTHLLENPFDTAVIMLEVELGEYLGVDDV